MHLQGVHDYLTNITDNGANDDIVFMMDALDIWLQLSPRTLVERFEDLGTSMVVVGAETGCWPNPQDSVSARIHGHFPSGVDFLAFCQSLRVEESQIRLFSKVPMACMKHHVGPIVEQC
jgi:hypothetical protein